MDWFLTSEAQDSWQAESAAVSAASMSCSAGLLLPGQGTWPDTMSHTGWADQMLTGCPVPAANCNGGVTVNPSGGFGTCSHNSWEDHAKQCIKIQVVCADPAVWLLRWCMLCAGWDSLHRFHVGQSLPLKSALTICGQPTCSCQCCM